MLDTSEPSVNSALQRARATLDERRLTAGRERAPLPSSPQERALVGRFADAFERGDVDGVVALLTDDAWLTMPPEPLEYQGPAAIAAFFLDLPWWGERNALLVPTRANGQPAFGYYLPDAHAPIAHASGLVVLTLEGERISAITRFRDNSLHPRFGLPRTLPTPRPAGGAQG
jgi:RNA polymerase sigma-70 factor (ECF subfamily)